MNKTNKTFLDIWEKYELIVSVVIAIWYVVICLILECCAFVDQRAKHIWDFFDLVDKIVFRNFIKSSNKENCRVVKSMKTAYNCIC